MTSNDAEDAMFTRRLWPWTICASFLLHGVAYASLGAAPILERAPKRKTELRFEVVQKAPPPEPPEPEPQPQPKPEPPKPAAQPAQQPEPAPLPPPAESEPPAAPAGVTLAGDGSGAGFAMPLGGGGALEPARVPRPAPVTVPVPVAPAARVPAEPALVAVSDLSSRPSPPALGGALERNYPTDARRRGLSGTARVRARIDPDGVVRRVSLVEESAAGFGAACSRTLSGSRWTPPKDHGGRSVATEIRYTCRFVVQ